MYEKSENYKIVASTKDNKSAYIKLLEIFMEIFHNLFGKEFDYDYIHDDNT